MKYTSYRFLLYAVIPASLKLLQAIFICLLSLHKMPIVRKHFEAVALLGEHQNVDIVVDDPGGLHWRPSRLFCYKSFISTLLLPILFQLTDFLTSIVPQTVVSSVLYTTAYVVKLTVLFLVKLRDLGHCGDEPSAGRTICQYSLSI